MEKFTVVAFYLDDHSVRIAHVEEERAVLAGLPDESLRSYVVCAVFHGHLTPAFVEMEYLHAKDEGGR